MAAVEDSANTLAPVAAAGVDTPNDGTGTIPQAPITYLAVGTSSLTFD